MGLWDKVKQAVKGGQSWVGGQVDQAWSKVPEARIDIDVKVDAKIRFDSADIRLGLEAIGHGLDSVGAGIQSGLSDLGAGVGTAGIALGQGIDGAGHGIGEGLTAVGNGIRDFDPSGGIIRRILAEADYAAHKFRTLQRIRHYLDTRGQPLEGDHLSFRFRNESDLIRSLVVRAVFQLNGQRKVIAFAMNQSPKPNDAFGWEQVVEVPFALIKDHSTLPTLLSIEAAPSEVITVKNKYEESRHPFVRVSVDVIRVAGPFQHYIGGGAFVSPKEHRMASSILLRIGTDPEKVDFGAVTIGDSHNTTLEIINLSGKEELTVYKAESANDSGQMSSRLTAKLQGAIAIPPDGRSTLDLTLEAAGDPETVSGRIDISYQFASTEEGKRYTKAVPFCASVVRSAAPSAPATVVSAGASSGRAAGAADVTAATSVCQLDLGDGQVLPRTAVGCVKVKCEAFADIEWHFYVSIQGKTKETVLCAGKNAKPAGCGRDQIWILQRGCAGTTASSHDNQESVSLVSTPDLGVVAEDPDISFWKPEDVRQAAGMPMWPTVEKGTALLKVENLFDKTLNCVESIIGALKASPSGLGVLDSAIEKLRDWLTGDKAARRIDELLQAVRAAESGALDSNIPFLVRIGRMLDKAKENDDEDALPIGCFVRACWSGTDVTDGKNPTKRERAVHYSSQVDRESILALQRPRVTGSDGKPWDGWDFLAIRVSVYEASAPKIRSLEIQIGQAYLMDVRILDSRNGEDLGKVEDPDTPEDGQIIVLSQSYPIRDYRLRDKIYASL